MSKKFHKPEHQVFNEPECEVFDKDVYHQQVIVDSHFLAGKRFLAYAEQWLIENPGERRLYYYALTPQISPQYFFSNTALGGELTEKWPPLLPGLHTIVLAQGRIELLLWVGDQTLGLKNLLTHFEHAVHVKNAGLQVDQFFITEPLTEDAKEIIEFLQGKRQTLQRLRNSPWPYGENHPASKETKIIIIGGGLAGCYLAHMMAEIGWRVALFESHPFCAKQGSGNAYSVLYPKLSLHQAPFTELLHQAYPYAYQIWRDILLAHPSLGRCLPLWQQGDAYLPALADFLSFEPQWFEQVTSPQMGLLMKKSLMIDMPKLCQVLLQHPLIETYFNHPVASLEYEHGQWQVGEERAPYCVIANGYLASQWQQTHFLGVKGMRGQMTHVAGFSKQDAVYCHQGHFLPEWRGVHAMGASYQSAYEHLNPCDLDDEQNLKPWRQFFNREDMQVLHQWVGIRGVSADHIPIVGFVPQEEAFKSQFNRWRHHANWVMDSRMPNYPGLFAFSGFGSRGLLTIPLLAKVLRNWIIQEPVFLANHLIQAISPARFLKKEMVKS